MLISVRALRACSLYRTSTSLLPLANVVQQKTVRRSFLTDGANVIGSTPDRNSPDFKVPLSFKNSSSFYIVSISGLRHDMTLELISTTNTSP